MTLFYGERELPARHRSNRDAKKSAKHEKNCLACFFGNVKVQVTANARRCGRAGASCHRFVGDKTRAGPCQDGMTSQEGCYC